MSKAKDRLFISVGDASVGTLGRSAESRANTVFSYHGPVEDSDAVSLTMPVRLESYYWEHGIHPLFEMHLPEGQLRAELFRRFSKSVRGFDDLALLGIVGPHQLGRIKISHTDTHSVLPETNVASLLVHDGAQDLFDELLSTYAEYSGVSGVQPKVLIRDSAEQAPELTRVTHRGATHLLKTFSESDFPQLAANEYFCMRAALHAGLAVPDFELSRQGRFLVVKRFDIGEHDYLGFEDMCVLSGWITRKKYDGSYQGCARMINEYVTPSRVTKALEDFFKMVALTAGIQNGDGHLKNFGLLYEHCGEDADVWLAPAYDLVTTTVYNGSDIMALLLAGSKGWPKRKMLISFGRTSCNLSEGRCNELLAQVQAGMTQTLDEMAEYRRSNPAFDEMGERMAAAWANGLRRSIVAD